MDQNGLRDAALREIDKVEWLPDWGKARIQGMVEGRPDWCVSRQRTWGAPIALFIHKETGEPHPETIQLIEQVASRVEQEGIEAWFALDPAELLGSDAEFYDKVPDTLDVWFDSGVTHACVLETRDGLQSPADLYLEGSDQHRGWFQSSLLTSTAMYGRAPYRQVLTHGFTVDAEGRKMSKSIGNVMKPQQVMKTLGADIIRLWVAATDYRAEMSVSDEILKRTADAYRRIRNTTRYLLSNLNDFDPAVNLVAPADMLSLDRWAVDRAAKLQQEVAEAYTEYEFHLIYQKIHNFCVTDMGGFYLDVTKDRQYTCQADSVARRSSQTAMYHIAEALVRWLAPILSFTADEIWQHMPGERSDSVFLETWYDKLFRLDETDAISEDQWTEIIRARSAVSKELEILRKNGDIGSGLNAEVTLICEGELKSALDALGDELRFALITSAATVKSDDDVDATQTELAGLKVRVFPSGHAKCDRCWHQREDVGSNPGHPDLCGRCITNIEGEGEVRHYV
jgi:isoleucyl-tRNA synthetase